jgi:hypothetical protein
MSERPVVAPAEGLPVEGLIDSFRTSRDTLERSILPYAAREI